MKINAWALAIGMLSAGLSIPHLQAATEILDQVVAIVDDDVIMASELRERVASVIQNLAARDIDPPAEDTLIRETLDRLILESIQMQKGSQAGVRISDAQLTAAMERLAGQNRMTLDEFQARLEQEGQSFANMREQIRQEMILQRVQAGNVNQRVQLTEQEVTNFLNTDEGRKLTQPEYRIVHALLALSPNVSAAKSGRAEAYMESLYQRIRAGESFEQVMSGSDSEFNITGGDLGWRKLDDLPSVFADVAPTLVQGETAAPFRSPSGLHLVYLNEKVGGDQIVAQTRVRHILIKPSEILSDDQARELALELKQRVAKGEDFAELARKYSKDIGSAQEGGSLGWTQRGQMVPEFEQAMATTEVGAISEPVRSQFGWHILEVLERRDQDMTHQAIENKAMEFLHNRKYQEELTAWLQKIRDEAFVDIK